jgi:hypothetical protein
MDFIIKFCDDKIEFRTRMPKQHPLANILQTTYFASKKTYPTPSIFSFCFLNLIFQVLGCLFLLSHLAS